MSNFNTAYDDVFRTLLVDCRELIIPVVNEVFHTNYIGTESVVLHENEIFMRQQDGEEEKVVTDSSFAIISFTGETKRYHLECQSSIDGSISYHVPTLKVQQYDIETIFEKNFRDTQVLPD